MMTPPWVATVVVAVMCAGVALLPSASAAARLLAATCGPAIADPLAEAPWPLTRLRPDLAWPLSTGNGVTVAVIDSGVSADHPGLAGKVLSGADYVEPGGGSGQCDENGHGTLIAGIIASRETVSAGFTFHGVAPGATIVPVKVLRDQRRSFEADLSNKIATAVRFVVDARGADVINLSLTTPSTPELEAAIRYALGKGAVVVAAAGNQGETGDSQIPYPAAYDGVIAVAGVDDKDQHVSTSSAGRYVDVAAPGDRIAGPSPAGGGYLFSEEGGTSFAAAYVSGVAALIRGYDPRLTPAQVAERITTTADHPAELWNPQIGAGVVDPARAVGALRLAGAGQQVRPEQVELAPVPPDRDHLVRVAAAWIGVIGSALAVLALVAVPVVRRGRQRRWQSP
jgi:type VII secretion-associated serine protease mycosin